MKPILLLAVLAGALLLQGCVYPHAYGYPSYYSGGYYGGGGYYSGGYYGNGYRYRGYAPAYGRYGWGGGHGWGGHHR